MSIAAGITAFGFTIVRSMQNADSTLKDQLTASAAQELGVLGVNLGNQNGNERANPLLTGGTPEQEQNRDQLLGVLNDAQQAGDDDQQQLVDSPQAQELLT